MDPHRDTQNPYQAPVAGASVGEVPATLVAAPQFGRGLYRDGKILVAAKGAVFPDRCVKCNAPADGYRLTRALYWHHPAIYLLIVAGILIYVIFAIVLRKSATFHVGVCPKHRDTRRVATILAWLTFLVGVMALISSFVVESLAMAFAGVLTTLVGITIGIAFARLISPKRIDNSYAWIRGAGEEFLASVSQDTGTG